MLTIYTQYAKVFLATVETIIVTLKEGGFMTYGDLNCHATGILIKEMARRALIELRKQRTIFEAEHKDNPDKKGEDFVTSADRAAQAIYLKTIRECFPLFGIVAEEEELIVPCLLDGANIYFTVDPLDGTKAYIRRQSHGIGTMISLVKNGEVIAACVGDVMTQEIYYFRPNSNKVHRVSEFDTAETLTIDSNRSLKSQYVLLRDAPWEYSDSAQKTARFAFKNIEVGGGSIGISFARLWKGEVGGIILLPITETPWDLSPVVGISKKLGFRFFDISDRTTGALIESPPAIKMQKYHRELETIVIHESRIEELLDQPYFRQPVLVAA